MSRNYGNFRSLGEFVELHCARGLHPQLPVEGAELDGFGDMIGSDGVGSREIGDGAGHFQNTIISARAEVHVVHRVLEQFER